MQLIRQLPEQSDRPTAVAIGNFDGLHLGHQAVIGRMLAAAREQGLVPSVLTFEPHPRRFFGRGTEVFRLERLSQKLTRLREAGVERIYMPRFDARFAARTADEFLTMVLGQSLGANVVVTGEDFAFGKARGGTSETLRAWGAERRVAVHSVPPVVAAGERCSSTAIRRALEAGDMGHAAALLGRLYTITGRVVHGDGRGATIGFPTANLALLPQLKHPIRGVYAIRAQLAGKMYDGVANLGVRPTVGEQAAESLEVHLFDALGVFYGERLEVRFVAKLRDERKFDGLEALLAQIRYDCTEAKTVLHSTL